MAIVPPDIVDVALICAGKTLLRARTLPDIVAVANICCTVSGGIALDTPPLTAEVAEILTDASLNIFDTVPENDAVPLIPFPRNDHAIFTFVSVTVPDLVYVVPCCRTNHPVAIDADIVNVPDVVWKVRAVSTL